MIMKKQNTKQSTMPMRYHKTPKTRRTTYRYEFADGTVAEIRPGEDGVTAEFIKMLHNFDDAEVRNNNKHARPTPTEEEKAERRKWEEEHPGEKADKNYNVSIDRFTSSDNGASTADHHEELVDPRARMPYDEDEPADIERLHAIVAHFPRKLKDTYDEVYRKNRNNVQAGKNLGISEGAVRLRVAKINEAIAADETLRKIYTRA